MPSTYELIKGETIGSSAASYTFTAIPSTFTDLVVRMSVRATNAADEYQVWTKINGSTASINSSTLVQAYDTTAQSGRSSSYPYGGSAVMGGAGGTANTFASIEQYYPNYAGSTNKVWSESYAKENNGSLQVVGADANLWSSTAAITSLVFGGVGATVFAAGSSFYLYGVKNA